MAPRAGLEPATQWL